MLNSSKATNNCKGSLPRSLEIVNMFSQKFYFLGIVTIILLSNPSQAFADTDNENTEVRAGNVKILLNPDGSTQIKTDRLDIKSESSKVQRARKYRQRTRVNRVIRVDEKSGSQIDSSESDSQDRRKVDEPTHSSSSSNRQVIRVNGNNRTVINSSTNKK
jgi:hypothetical protein